MVDDARPPRCSTSACAPSSTGCRVRAVVEGSRGSSGERLDSQGLRGSAGFAALLGARCDVPVRSRKNAPAIGWHARCSSRRDGCRIDPRGSLDGPPRMVDDLLASSASARRARTMARGEADRDAHLLGAARTRGLQDQEAGDASVPRLPSFEARERTCRTEVRINRRLAPGPISASSRSSPHRRRASRFGGRGEMVDWAVQMRRLDDERRADVLLASGELRRRASRCARLADRRVPRATRERPAESRRWARPTTRAQRARQLLSLPRVGRRLRTLGPTMAGDSSAGSSRSFPSTAAFREAGATLRVRDGHGDLRLEHVFFAPRATSRSSTASSSTIAIASPTSAPTCVPLDGPRAARPGRPRRAVRRDVRARVERLRPLSRPRLLRELSCLRAREDCGVDRDEPGAPRRGRRDRPRGGAAVFPPRRGGAAALGARSGARRRRGRHRIRQELARGASRRGAERAGGRRGSNAQAHDRPRPDRACRRGAWEGAYDRAFSARSTPRCCAAPGWCSRPADR